MNNNTLFFLNGTDVRPRRITRRAFLISSTTLTTAMTLEACSRATPPSSTTASSRGMPSTVVYIAGVQGAPFYQMMAKGVTETATSHRMTVLTDAPADWDAHLQTQIVHASIAKKVDGIIIAPCDSQMLIAPLKQAADAGIQVVTVDTFLGTGDYSTGNVTFPLAAIGSDNVKGGLIAGEALIKAMGGKGKVYLQNNDPGASTAVQRSQGFRRAIAATRGAVTLVAEQFDNGDMSKATTQTAAILQAHPDLAAIFGATYVSAEGAAAAIENAQKSGMIKVCHFDSTQQGILDLRRGIVDLVIGQKPYEMGSLAVEYLLKAFEGKSQGLPKQVTTDFIVIDRHNVDTPEAQAAVYH